MTTPAIVLDAAAFDDITRNMALRALFRATANRGGSVSCSSVTIAESARGLRRVSEVHHALAMRFGASSIQVRPVDDTAGFLVGALLHSAQLDSSALGDACVLAACSHHPQALVITSDPADIVTLAQHLPGVRVRTARPDLSGFETDR